MHIDNKEIIITTTANELVHPSGIREVINPPEMWDGRLSHLDVWKRIRKHFVSGSGPIANYFEAFMNMFNDPVWNTNHFSSEEELAIAVKITAKESYQCVLSGHGYHRPEDGTFIVPLGVTIFFFCLDSQLATGTIEDRFPQMQRLVRDRMKLPEYVTTGNETSICKNYRMIPLYGSFDHQFSAINTLFLKAETFDPLKKQCVIGVRRYSMQLSDIIEYMRNRLPPNTEIILYWAACREEITNQDHDFASIKDGFLTRLSNDDMEASLPTFNGQKGRWSDTATH